ncbi:MAG: MFS transporter [Pseudonocardia sp.]|jgi:MFS family permease
MDTRWRMYLVWAVGVLAYLVAVLQRSSFGVAGLAAAGRFGAEPAALATFVVLQLVVYAALQVPVGLLLDRFGARTLVVVGGLTMVAGQVLLALATALPLAYLARALVGAGDALTFISVLRVVNAWFPARRAPLMTQLTGLLGQLGQVLSAVPLVALLRGPGWVAAFGSAAGLGVLAVVLALVVIRDRPPGSPAPVVREPRVGLGTALRTAWLTPGTRLGFWSHMGTQFSGTVFVLLWGVPYLVVAQGLSPARASALLTLFVLAGIAVGPVIGELTARHPLRRSWLVLTIIGATATAWTVVLASPGPAPGWLLVVLVLVLAFGAPGSMVGFDYARTFNPSHRQGTAVGIVNVGGFSASVLVVLAIGMVLDGLGGSGGYDPTAFRLAWCTQYVVWAVAVVGVLRTRRLARRELAADGIVVPPLREVWARRRASPANHRL